MNQFIIISTICLVVFLSMYYFFFETEKMHQFNRFYLLFSLVFSMAIPFLQFEIVNKIIEIPNTTPVSNLQNTTIPISNVIEKPNDYLYLLAVIYAIGVIVFAIKFVTNILRLVSQIKNKTNVKYQNAILVLVPEKIIPHSFFNFIFLNENEYKTNQIQPELYQHELVHVSQKHSFDVVFIEILKIILWFNPVLYFYKNAIQLNHEFIADSFVINTTQNITSYQQLLLQKCSINRVDLTSNFNYLITKKRLIMMTKTTKKSIALIKKVSILPVLSFLIYFFCIDFVAMEKTILTTQNLHTNSKISINQSNEVPIETYFKGVRFKVMKQNKGIKNRKVVFNKLFEELTAEDKKIIQAYLFVPKALVKKSPTETELKNFKNNKKYAIWINDKNMDNSELNNYKTTDFVYFDGSSVLKNARSKKFPQPFQYRFYTNAYFEKNNMGKQKMHYGNNDCFIIISPNFKFNTNDNKVIPIVKSSVNTDNSEIYLATMLTEQPSFNGGVEAFTKYISENFIFTDQMKQNNVKGRVFVDFVVKEDGSLENISIIRDLGFGVGEQVVKLLQNAPKWNPGKINEKAVNVRYSLPIMIKYTN